MTNGGLVEVSFRIRHKSRFRSRFRREMDNLRVRGRKLDSLRMAYYSFRFMGGRNIASPGSSEQGEVQGISGSYRPSVTLRYCSIVLLVSQFQKRRNK